MEEVDLVTIGAMLFNGVGALLLKAGLDEEGVGKSLATAFGAPTPEEL
jgi:hypothetical protein